MDHVPTCYRHPKTEAYLRCSRCERHICGACSSPGSVGQHCPSCVKEQGTQTYIRPNKASGRFAGAPATKIILAVTVVVSLAAELGLINRGFFAVSQTTVAAGAWWGLFSHALIHVGFIHLAFNMYALYIFGVALERSIGWKRFAGLYLLATATSGLAVFLLSVHAAVGASGAIWGLMAVWFAASYQSRGTAAGKAQFRSMTGLLVLNVIISLTPGISWQGHFGGMIGGLAAFLIWRKVKDPRFAAWISVGISFAIVLFTQLL